MKRFFVALQICICVSGLIATCQGTVCNRYNEVGGPCKGSNDKACMQSSVNCTTDGCFSLVTTIRPSAKGAAADVTWQKGCYIDATPKQKKGTPLDTCASLKKPSCSTTDSTPLASITACFSCCKGDNCNRPTPSSSANSLQESRQLAFLICGVCVLARIAVRLLE